jgi:hypothetical protein
VFKVLCVNGSKTCCTYKSLIIPRVFRECVMKSVQRGCALILRRSMSHATDNSQRTRQYRATHESFVVKRFFTSPLKGRQAGRHSTDTSAGIAKAGLFCLA